MRIESTEWKYSMNDFYTLIDGSLTLCYSAISLSSRYDLSE